MVYIGYSDDLYNKNIFKNKNTIPKSWFSYKPNTQIMILDKSI